MSTFENFGTTPAAERESPLYSLLKQTEPARLQRASVSKSLQPKHTHQKDGSVRFTTHIIISEKFQLIKGLDNCKYWYRISYVLLPFISVRHIFQLEKVNFASFDQQLFKTHMYCIKVALIGSRQQSAFKLVTARLLTFPNNLFRKWLMVY